ncbi:MAG: hypothetical protein LBI42_15570 [Chitinispirillales bacterium]|jgi:hypothetical protein|nr:hypothetical protein [Chitinispirillales bacterium]
MKKISCSSLVLLMFLWLPAAADGISGIDAGVGSRALSFANNHTAVVNDISAVYWNPAALAFLPVREFQISIDAARSYGATDVTGKYVSSVPGASMSDYRDRIRLSGLGAMSAIPTTQGGLTLAAAYENPYVFDEFGIYKYKLGGKIEGEESFRYGGLNSWSGSFGVQVAKGLAAGMTISLITGTERMTVLGENTWGENEIIDAEFECKYMGYGIRGGLLYNPIEYLMFGMRINMPIDLRFKEEWSGKIFWDDETEDKLSLPKAKGRAYRAPSGALGAGIKLPWITIALDGRFTMPYTFILPSENIPKSSQARYFKCGAGVGLEVPLFVAPVVLRAGYSYDEYDIFSTVLKFDGDDEFIDWDPNGLSVDKNRQTITAGMGIFTSGTGIELSYGYQTWGVAHKNSDRLLKQTFAAHRVMTTFITRF